MEKKRKKPNIIMAVGKDVLSGIGHRHMGTYASSTALYYFLAIVPILIFISALLPLTGIKELDLIVAVTSVTPDILDNLAAQIITEAYTHSANLIPIAVVSLLWTSIQGNLALLQGLNDVYREEEQRPYYLLCLISLLWTVILMFMFLVLVYFIFSDQIRNFFMVYMPGSNFRLRRFTWARRIFCFFMAAIIFAVLYTYMPAGRRKYMRQIPGAVFSAAVWVIFSIFFAKYVNGVNKYTMFYGSLTTLAILLFWMYCCFYILLLGGFINDCFGDYIERMYARFSELPHRKLCSRIQAWHAQHKKKHSVKKGKENVRDGRKSQDTV